MIGRDVGKGARHPLEGERHELSEHDATYRETFIALTESTSPEKISISDIVSASGKNRKTFYYHSQTRTPLSHGSSAEISALF